MLTDYEKIIMDLGINGSLSESGKPHNDTSHLSQFINTANAGVWEYNVNTKEVKWSAGFFTMLGYEPGEIEASYDYFFENIIYHDDKSVLSKMDTSPLHIRLLTKNNGYRWFDVLIKKYDDKPDYLRYGLVTDIHQYKLAAIKAAQNQLFSSETAKIAKIGGWQINAFNKHLTLLREAYDIFELQPGLPIALDEFISFFDVSDRSVLASAIDNTIRYCRAFDIELLFRTAKNNEFWVRCKGLPFINDLGECTEIRGIIQRIDTNNKKQEIGLRDTVRLLEDQNKRLQNFAYMVSHNLRSHAGNLKLMVNLYSESKVSEQEDIFSHIRSISNSLNETVNHLDEIVKIQVETSKERKSVDLEAAFKNTMELLSSNINSTNAKIEYDFTECPTVDYIPAYMESILQNLLTNALKYRNPDRRPVINCRTFKEHGHIYLTFQDNGIGIDMEKNGDKIFGMYKTFHHNPDAKGIGLFITRNQIEALGGSIKVDSWVNVGTKFTIRLV
jgi:signal transduction histidine kinase